MRYDRSEHSAVHAVGLCKDHYTSPYNAADNLPRDSLITSEHSLIHTEVSNLSHSSSLGGKKIAKLVTMLIVRELRCHIGLPAHISRLTFIAFYCFFSLMANWALSWMVLLFIIIMIF